jgi:hypothetical protein
MKLITEHSADIELLTESDAKTGEKKYFIEGIFMQSEKKNRNGRVYKRNILESAVDKYVTEQVSKGRAVGELDHPEGPTVNLDRVSHKIDDLRWDGDDVYGKAQILNTPCGRIVKDLLDGGVQLGVSSRGMGSLTQSEDCSYVGEDFFLNTVDIVQDPSAHSAFVNGILEGVEWFKDESGIILPKSIEEQAETEQVVSEERMLAAAKKFLSGISR